VGEVWLAVGFVERKKAVEDDKKLEGRCAIEVAI
jgi:hypothetical protein